MKTKRPRKEALFVQVPSPDGTVGFHDVTALLGKPMPFKSPKATCGMRVLDDIVSFSLLHLTKKTAASMVTKELLIPRGPLTRVEKRAVELNGEIGVDEVLLESDSGLQKCKLVIDGAGVGELEPIADDISFELPKEAVRLSIYIKNSTLGRTIAIGFIGHPGRPGSAETLRRIASKALFSLTQLSQFRVLTGMVGVIIPSAPRQAQAPARRHDERVQLEIPVWLFEAGIAPVMVANGMVMLEIDLDIANPATTKLLYHFTPDEAISGLFETYKTVLESTITEVIREHIDDTEIYGILVDIVLGEINSGTVERLRGAIEKLASGLDLTPQQRQFHV